MPAQMYLTHSEDETIALGRKLAPELRGVVLLVGNLGAGKTTLVKGIADGEDVSSPTFTLIHEYRQAYHIDLYRLETEGEVLGLGIDELIDTGKPVLIEWGERFPRLFPPPRIEIRLEDAGGDSRRIAVSYPE
jgi:tRNA threonylcarbamoyladenosine biosynthesis protein TsaE